MSTGIDTAAARRLEDVKVALGAVGLLGGLALVIGSIAAAKTMNNEEDLERGRKGNPRHRVRKLKASVQAWDSVHVAISHPFYTGGAMVHEYGYQEIDGVETKENLGTTEYASVKRAVSEAMKKADKWELSARKVFVFDNSKLIWKTGMR